MKKSLYIPILAAVALLFSSCEQEYTQSTNWGDWEIFRGYMQFSTAVSTSTRADKVLNMKGRDFGVIGYKYSGTTNWETAKAVTRPMTDFYNQQVFCDANGVCTYDVDITKNGNQLKQWEDDSRYAFFAYHPFKFEGSGITLSNSDVVGTPYLTYTYGWLEEANTGDPVIAYNDSRVFDLMTAEDINCDGSRNVALGFKHRLFAIEVLANNYNENEYEYEYEKDENGTILTDEHGNPIIKKDAEGNKVFAKDADGNKIILKDNSQSVSNLILSIKGLNRTSMEIPLLDSEVENNIKYTSGSVGEDNIVTFNISGRKVDIPAFDVIITEEDGSIRGGGYASSISKLGSANGSGYVMLIPQYGELEFALNWVWDKNDTEFNPENVSNTLKSTMEFEAGKLYQIIINFVGSGVTIALIEAGSWDTLNVPYTFE